MILAIDQGTTGTTSIVFDDEGRPRGRGYSEFEQHFPRPGWGEHDAGEIWEVTGKVAIAALADAGVQGSELPGSGSPTSARRWWPGTRGAGSPCTAPWSGRTAAPRPAATSCARPATRDRKSGV